MIEMELHASNASLAAVLQEILGSISPPSSYSLEEDGARLPLPQVGELMKQIEKSAVYMWSEDCMYELSFAGEAMVLFAMSERADIIHDVISRLSSLEVLFAYACDSDERAHRNRISRKMDYGVHEAWVGRDFSKYLPGIYWITVLPVVEQQRLGISVDALREISTEVSLVQNRNWFVRLYDGPGAWMREAEKVDAWCEITPGVFRKSLAVEALGQAKNFMDASDVIADWS